MTYMQMRGLACSQIIRQLRRTGGDQSCISFAACAHLMCLLVPASAVPFRTGSMLERCAPYSEVVAHDREQLTFLQARIKLGCRVC